MRTLFLNPPSFEGFDGGAGSRWPASREIESYWYPVWLCYPAGMLEDSKVVDAPPHKISIEQTVQMAKDFELMVLFTSSPGFHVDVKIAEMMKDVNPKMQVAFVGPPVTIEPEKSLRASRAIDFVVRREFDHQIANYAKGTPLSELPGVSFWKDGDIVNNPEGGVIENLDELPWVTKVYKRDLDFRRYKRTVSVKSVYFVLHFAWVSGHVYFLLVAANPFGASLASQIVRRRGRRVQASAAGFSGAEGNFLRRRHVQLQESARHRALK